MGIELFWDEYRQVWTSKESLQMSLFLQEAMKSAECSFHEGHFESLLDFYEKLDKGH